MEKAMIKPLTTFSLRLTKQLTCHPKFPNSNVAFSPLSLHSVLGLLTAGSTGRTQQQLLSFLDTANSASDLSKLHSHVSDVVLADGSPFNGPCIKYASGVWVDDDTSTTLKKSFREIARSVYKAEAHPVPFRSAPEECRIKINKWVEEITPECIKDLIAPGVIRSDTRLVLGNALYFNGKWDLKFDPLCTKSGIFHLIDGSTIETPFMSSSKSQFISVYDGFKVLKLPYKRGHDRREFSLYIFLPNTLNGLLDLSTKLISDPNFLNRHIPTERVRVGDFRIPKFKIITEFTFSSILNIMGLQLPFLMTGDFSEMVDSPEDYTTRKCNICMGKKTIYSIELPMQYSHLHGWPMLMSLMQFGSTLLSNVCMGPMQFSFCIRAQTKQHGLKVLAAHADDRLIPESIKRGYC